MNASHQTQTRFTITIYQSANIISQYVNTQVENVLHFAHSHGFILTVWLATTQSTQRQFVLLCFCAIISHSISIQFKSNEFLSFLHYRCGLFWDSRYSHSHKQQSNWFSNGKTLENIEHSLFFQSNNSYSDWVIIFSTSNATF